MKTKTISRGIPITGVARDSIGADLGITAGDCLLAVSGQYPQDLIDYRYLVAGENVSIHIRTREGREFLYEIEKDYDEGLGLEFASKCFTAVKRCRNKCIFCFVDQMPPGMRRSLYIKDDDYRLSFLDGSFITLTNLNAADIRRVIDLRLSPLYISVHTTDSHLRSRIMGNGEAGAIKERLGQLAAAGIDFHAQVVLLPGINDGFYLEETVMDLIKYWPHARSLALVPVGLTAHRRGLYPLKGYDKRQAQRLIRWGQGWQRKLRKRYGLTFLYMAVEFYLQADEPLPAREYYDDFPQLENGIGLLRLFYDELAELSLPRLLARPFSLTLVTGVSAAQAVGKLAQRLLEVKGLDVRVEVVANKYFGPAVTVAGLLTGRDIVEQLKGKELGDGIVLPAAMLRADSDVFLDNLRLQDVSDELGVNIWAATGPRALGHWVWSKGGEAQCKNP